MTLLRDKSPPVAPFPFPTFAINKVEKLEKKLEEGCGRVSKLFSLMLFILCGGLGLGLTLPHLKKNILHSIPAKFKKIYIFVLIINPDSFGRDKYQYLILKL